MIIATVASIACLVLDSTTGHNPAEVADMTTLRVTPSRTAEIRNRPADSATLASGVQAPGAPEQPLYGSHFPDNAGMALCTLIWTP